VDVGDGIERRTARMLRAEKIAGRKECLQSCPFR
jgi:hypothetical protein